MATDSYGAIWDVDGTLVDTAELHFRAWHVLCQELDRSFSRADFAATFGRRNPEILEHLFPGRFCPADMDGLGDRKEVLYRDSAARGIALLPGVRLLLDGLRAEGFRQAIGSSAPLVNVDLILELTGTRHYFSAVSSMEDTQRGKPDPQVFLVAAAKLELSPARCVVVEDAVAGVEAARAGGMRCVAVALGGHHPEARLKGAGADLVVDTLESVDAARVRALFGGQ